MIDLYYTEVEVNLSHVFSWSVTMSIVLATMLEFRTYSLDSDDRPLNVSREQLQHTRP